MAQAVRGKDRAIFQVKAVTYKPPAQLVDMVVCNNIIVLGLDTCRIVRLDLDNPKDLDEVEVPRKNADDRIHRLFMDPTGRHLIVALESGDNFYLHLSYRKFKALSKMKGVVIESVAWNRISREGASTREILIGTSKGLIYEAEIEPSDAGFFEKREEKYFKQVYAGAAEQSQPITGLRFELFPTSGAGGERKFLVVAATPTRIYHFIGTAPADAQAPVFAHVFEGCDNMPSFLELPGEPRSSELHFFSRFGGLPTSFAWSTGPGIYTGSLVFGSQVAGESAMTDIRLVPYPAEEGAFELPLSFLLTEFHFLFLYGDRFDAVSILSDRRVLTERLDGVRGRVRKLVSDAVKGTMWVLHDGGVLEIVAHAEDRNVWRMYLDKRKYDMALQYCVDNAENRDTVLTAQADNLFESGNFMSSAVAYAQTKRPFEDVTLKFIEKGERDALMMYLLKKLDTLKAAEKAQIVMVATWLVELYLNKLNVLKEEGKTTGLEQLQLEFRRFLQDARIKDNLNRQTTYDLIASHGRVDDMLFYAALIEDYERVINHHIQTGDYRTALRTLSKQNDEELFYKFSPILMLHVPQETVDAWIANKGLEPSRLIPALVRYDQHNATDAAANNHAVRYLEHCVMMDRNRDPAIHNYLLSLYAKMKDDSRLLSFLNSQLESGIMFDLKYALRLCKEEGKLRACVHIYSAMGLYEEAVNLALQVDVDLAKINADRPEDDDALRKKLWLCIARHVVEKEKDIRRAMAFVNSCDLLKIEDILPFFPDFTTIDHFKDAICTSLDGYNKHIGDLKHEMDEATQSAKAIRADIQELRNKFGIVHSTDSCSLCRFLILSRPFYMFPCEHLFHADCLVKEASQYLSNVQRQRVIDLYSRVATSVAPVGAASGDDIAQVVTPFDRLRNELDDIIAAECVLCGEQMIRSVDRPFVRPDEDAVARSWSL